MRGLVADPAQFFDMGPFYVCLAPQGSDDWKWYRTMLITASKFRRCRNRDYWSKIEQLIEDYQNSCDSTIDNPAMAHGRRYESEARDDYKKKYGYAVSELSLSIPKWDLRIGASPDGLIYDPKCPLGPLGALEIKCPHKGMYDGLLWRLQQTETVLGYDHIKPEHYDQMQGQMAVLQRSWCDYFVYSKPIDGRIYTERIPFDREYWQNELYPEICRFFKWAEQGYVDESC